MLERFGVRSVCRDQVDLARQRLHVVIVARNALGRRKRMERRADFREAMLDAGQHRGIDPAPPVVVDAIGQRADLGLNGLERSARQRVRQGAADLAELAA